MLRCADPFASFTRRVPNLHGSLSQTAYAARQTLANPTTTSPQLHPPHPSTSLTLITPVRARWISSVSDTPVPLRLITVRCIFASVHSSLHATAMLMAVSSLNGVLGAHALYIYADVRCPKTNAYRWRNVGCFFSSQTVCRKNIRRTHGLDYKFTTVFSPDKQPQEKRSIFMCPSKT